MKNFDNINWSPDEYAKAAVLAEAVGNEMLQRLEWLTLTPKVILDIGCGVGQHSNALAERFPQATILAVDQSEVMLQSAQSNKNSNTHYICGQSPFLSLPDQSVDLVFANFFLPWQEELTHHLKEWRRVLKPNGVLLLSALGPETMCECAEIIDQKDMPMLVDMHDLGDALVAAQFSEPVVDLDNYTLTYRDPLKLLDELIATGMWTPEKAAKEQALSQLSALNEWAVSYEIVLAHAFAPMEIDGFSASDPEVKIPFMRMRQMLRKTQ